MELFSNRNVVCQTAYQVVWCPKYRKPILTGRIATGLRKLLDKISEKRKWRIGALEVQPDHVRPSQSDSIEAAPWLTSCAPICVLFSSRLSASGHSGLPPVTQARK